MTHIRVNKPGLRIYETQTEASFVSIMTELDKLSDGANAIVFKGQNGHDFKQGVADATVEMGTTIKTQITTFCGKVAAATTDIAGQLGGSPLVLDPKLPNVSTISVEAVVEGEDEVETDQLRQLQETVTSHCSKIRGHVDAHQDAFIAVGSGQHWVGNSYDATRGFCTTLNTGINDAVTACLDTVKKYAADQDTAVTAADNRG